MKKQKYNYVFSINELTLTKKNYPFDFFIRITSQKSGQYWDSPKIYVKSFQYAQELPWKFKVSSDHLLLQFIQLSAQKQRKKQSIITEIKRGFAEIQQTTEGQEKQIQLINERTQSKVCTVSYSLIDLQEKQRRIKQNLLNQNSQTMKKTEVIDQQRVGFSKIDQTQLTSQISKLNETLDKMLKYETEEHKKFTNYLDQSSSIIKKLNQENKDKVIKEEQEYLVLQKPQKLENQEFLSTHEKWYKEKYGRRRLSTKSPFLKQLQSQQKEITLQYSKELTDQELSIIFSNLQIEAEHKPNQIYLFKKNPQPEIILSMKSPKGLQRWNRNFVLPDIPQIFVNVKGQPSSQMNLNGFLGAQHYETSCIPLFDEKGSEKGRIKFEHKKIGIQGIQTADIFLPSSDEDKGIVKDEIQEQQTEKKQNQQNLQKQSVEYKQVQPQKEIKVKSHDKQIILQNKNQETEYKKQEKIVQEKEERKDSLKQQKQNKEVNEFLQKKSGIQEQALEESIYQKYKLNERYITSEDEADISNNEQKREVKRYRKKKVKAQEKSLIITKQDIAIDTNELGSPKRKFELISNSLSAFYIPFNVGVGESKEQSISQQVLPNRKIKTENMSINSQFQTKSQKHTVESKINLKINSLSIKLNIKDYQGKYCKLEVKERQPYITQTINCNQNLHWKGRGYFFENVSFYDQLRIHLFTDHGYENSLVGTANVHLSLLNLDQSNNISFFHEYLRNQTQGQIGQLVLGYENINKKERSLSLKKRGKSPFIRDQLIGEEKFMKNKSESVRKKKSKVSKSNTNRTNQTKRLYTNLGENNLGKYQNNYPPLPNSLKSRKYTGGNIIIGRAPRFRIKDIKREEQPGPGQYDVHSTFERHGSPL